jgi:hypothetical protein
VLRQEVEALRSEPLDQFTLAWLTTFLGLTALYEGDYERSGALARESLAIYRELGDKRGISLCHIDLGFIQLVRGNHEPAAALLEESLRVLQGSEDKFCLAYGFFGLAAVGPPEQSLPARRGCGGSRRPYARKSALFPLRIWSSTPTTTKAG